MPVYSVSDDRDRLREPRGDVVQGDALIAELAERDYHRLICVGDRVSLDVATSRIDADICVVDGRIERTPIAEDRHNALDAARTLETANPAGEITEDAWNTVREAIAHTCRTTVRVDGEEDLLALPAFLFTAPDSLVVYGHWEEGAVIVEPDAAQKAFVRDLIGINRFPHVIVGGSWDRFHAGHRYLLLAAFEHGQHVDIGICTDEMVAEKLDDADHAPFSERRDAVATFLETFGLRDRAELIEITDFRGNAVEADADVLMVTPDTMANAKQINQERVQDGRPPLKLAALDPLPAADGDPLRASRIRDGAIDRNGLPQT